VNGFWGGEFVLITLVGTAVGVVAGMFGVGGGFLIVPVLNIILGIPMQIAVGSTACQMLGPATTSVLARRMKRDDLKLPLIVAGGLLIGVFAGAEVLHRLMESSTMASAAESAFSKLRGDAVVLAIYLILLLGLGLFALWESGRELINQPVDTGWLAGLRVPPLVRIAEDEPRMSIVVIAWFGLVVGFLSGLLGISGGLLLLPGLIYLLGLPWHRAVASSMLIVWIVAAQSTIAHSIHDHIRLPVVIGLLVGGTLGARIGVEWSDGLPPVYGRRSFGWLALAAAGMIAIKLAMSAV
jgi:uncharacterized membrane protein YfcA